MKICVGADFEISSTLDRNIIQYVEGFHYNLEVLRPRTSYLGTLFTYFNISIIALPEIHTFSIFRSVKMKVKLETYQYHDISGLDAGLV